MSAPVSRSQELGGLAGHLDGFVRAVREAGIPVGISQAVDAAEMHALRQRAADQQREVQRITSATLEGRFLAG